MVLLLTLNPRCGKRQKLSMPVIFSTTMLSASLYGKDHPPLGVDAPGKLISAYKVVTPEHSHHWND